LHILTFDKILLKELHGFLRNCASVVVRTFLFVKNIYFKFNSLNLKLATKYKVFNTTYIDIKGTVARDFRPLVFFMNRPHMGP
jgi:hypothetical protein